jgi:hypothetical protein
VKSDTRISVDLFLDEVVQVPKDSCDFRQWFYIQIHPTINPISAKAASDENFDLINDKNRNQGIIMQSPGRTF